ncbi:MAG: hypothetical protein KDI79_08475 [Anaerolineae bacterium]|nr:hypothetical protein [Anaerolineae bacterium]
MVNVHFSDFFNVSPKLLEEYGAFNVSLINDLPVFIDPFLIFNSRKPEYQELHENVIRYVKFLRDKSLTGQINDGLLTAWFRFGEVKQNWLGYSMVGNRGSGLGSKFATALNKNLNTLFADFGQEKITHGSHLEKLCLVTDGVGRDNISDFTTNLIKEFLLEYTQTFANNYISPELRKVVVVEKVRFNYFTESWERDTYNLPFYDGDFILLTPKDILTKDDIWISKKDLYNDYDQIAFAISNEQLRAQINNYFLSILPREPQKEDLQVAIAQVIRKFPEFIEYYIRYKEERGDEARAISSKRVFEVEMLFIEQVAHFIQKLLANTGFYERQGDTLSEARERVLFLKNVIENKDGYRLFYLKGKPIKREQDLQILFRLTWYSTPSDVNRETNNGRGPVDFKISRGSSDKSLVEFKLASNTQLKRNLEKQVAIYERANDTDKSLKTILYFSKPEFDKVKKILRELELENDPDIILIDARADNKPSASKA